MFIYPYPQKITVFDELNEYSTVSYITDDSLKEEEYKIDIAKNSISVYAKGDMGFFRAKSTLKQILAWEEILCMQIHDWPTIENRGIMLDVSRSKIPSLETLLRLVDMFADLKINQLQLYMEGYPFAYKSYPEVWKDTTPITPEEIQALDKYCKERFITLIPNQNCFGHMSPWLKREEFNHLAECPDGFIFANEQWDPHSLDPQNPESFELVKNLFNDLLPNFTADTVNINCDETLELGWGKSKEICEEKGVHRVYFDYLLKVIEFIKSKGKKVMFWGDIINKAPELLKELPENVIPINWGYSPVNPPESACQEYQKLNLKYYNAPGTQSWNTLLGNTKTMFVNAENAVNRAIQYDAIGVIDTDWGDLNHPHYISISYAPFAYFSGLSWNNTEKQKQYLCDYLNKYVFKDTTNRYAQLLLDAGRYHEKFDFSKTKRGFVIGILYYPLEEMTMAENGEIAEVDKLEKYLDEIEMRANEIDLPNEEGKLIKDELYNSIRILKFTCELARYKLDAENREAHLKNIIAMEEIIIPEHKRLWRIRNKESGLKDSVNRISKMR